MAAIQNLIEQVGSLSKEQLLGLDPDTLAEIDLVLEEAKNDAIEERCKRLAIDEVDGHLVAREDAGCLWWLQNVTQTYDDHWLAKGTPQKAPFPRKSYFRYLFGAMMRPIVHPSELCQQLYIPKSRQMMTSLSACGLTTWMCQFVGNIFWVMQAGTEAKALELMRYVEMLDENQPEFLKHRNPLTKNSSLEKAWANGSRVLAVAGGQNQIRGLHPFGYVSDEAAFQPEFTECINAVLPVAKMIIAISTGSPGPFADACSL